MEGTIIRPVSVADDLQQITEIIRTAYARHAANNLRYWATYQPPEDTALRFASGQGFVAEAEGMVIGTITVRPPNPKSDVAAFRDPETWTITQFAISPERQGCGLGRKLHQTALAHAFAQGGRTMGLDTARPATDLIEMYERWGYRIVGEADWRPKTNYISVVMVRPIADHSRRD